MTRILGVLLALALLILASLWWSRSVDAPTSTAPSEPLATAPTNTAQSADGSGNTTAPSSPSGVTVPALTVDDLPDGPLRNDLLALPEATRASVLRRLAELGIPAHDFDSIRVTTTGAFFYVCALPPSLDAAALPESTPAPEAVRALDAAPVPITSPPVFHSRPGATRVAYLDFNGHTVTGTTWNAYYDETEFTPVPYDTDGDPTTFSPTEQAAIAEIWSRVAEDFAPFDIDVTTEAPDTFGNQTARLLITAKLDAAGRTNPDANVAGGVAFVGVFGSSIYPTASPAFIYHDNLVSPAAIAEAASHELGHNLGLFHDGTHTRAYYSGHGSGETTWAPIMGSGYTRNVTQWSKGEYHDANNNQDDLAVISSRLTYVQDDHGDALDSATPLTVDGVNLTASGIIERATDTDHFSFSAGAGNVVISATPFRADAGPHGGNLDVRLELYDVTGRLLAAADPASKTTAQLNVPVAAGTYSVRVLGAASGSPLTNPPTGYTGYGSLGHYRLTGTHNPPTALPPSILTQPRSVSAVVGDSITFSVSAAGTNPLSYQWRKDGSPLSGATAATYSFTSSAITQSGSYDVVVTNSVGQVTSSPVTLTLAAQAEPPNITQQPGSQSVTAGAAVRFTVTATGSAPLAYQWYREGVALAGATASALELSTATPSSAGNYTVRVTNSAGTALSSPAALNVLFPPSFAQQPGNASVAAGATASFSVTVQASPVATLRWQRSTDGGVTWSDLFDSAFAAGTTTPTLSLPAVSLADSGRRYRCVATNSVGNTTSASAELLVGDFPAVVEIATGSYFNLFRKADGTVWASGINTNGQFGNGTDNTSTPVARPVQVATDVAAIAAGSSHSLLLKTDGSLWGAGLNGQGELGDGTIVLRPRFIPLATDVVAIAAGSYFSAFITSDGRLWTTGRNPSGELGDGTTIGRRTPVNIATDVRAVSCGYEHLAFITTRGELRVVGNNRFSQLGDGTTTDRAQPITLATDVRHVVAGYGATYFIKDDGTVWATGIHRWKNTPDATGTSEVPVQLATGGVRLATGLTHVLFLDSTGQLEGYGDNRWGQLGGGSASYSVGSAVPITTQPITFAGGNLNSFWVTAAGDTWAAGRNTNGQLGDGSTVDQIVPVKIISGVPAPPTPTAPPIATDGRSSDAVRLSWPPNASATGYEIWRHTTDDLAGASLVADVAGTSFWADYDVTIGTTYHYWIRATNPVGAGAFSAANTGFIVAPESLPQFVTAPEPATIAFGETATFTVAVTGSPAPSLQWQISSNGGSGWTSLSEDGLYRGTTNETLVIDAVTSGIDGYLVRCVATNDFGATASSSALLSVDTTPRPPIIKQQPEPLTVVEGATGSLSVVAVGTGTLTYQWRRNGTAIAGASAPTYALTAATFAQAGDYDVVVTGNGGSTASAAVAVIVKAADLLTPREIRVSANANSSGFKVNTSGTWRVESRPSWTVVIPFSSTEVSVQIQANLTGTPRSGAIVVNGESVMVHQLGRDGLDEWEWIEPRPSGTTINGVERIGDRFFVMNDRLQTSTDGLTWTDAANPGFSDLAWNGSLYVGVGTNIRAYRSSDGVTWASTSINAVLGSTLSNIEWHDGVFVAAGSLGKIVTSPDGITWTVRDSGTTQTLWDLKRTGDVFLAVGDGGTVLTSPDGITWTPHDLGTTFRFATIGYNGSRWVLTTNNDKAWVSDDLLTWQVSSLGGGNYPRKIEWTHQQFVAAVNNGSVLTSPDGLTWTKHALDWGFDIFGGVSLSDVASDGNRLIAGGRGGVIWESTDAANWTALNTVLTENLQDVDWNGEQFLVVGYGGTIASSPDGETWIPRTSGTTNSLLCVLWDGAKYLVGGTSGVLLSSPDGVAWTTIEAFSTRNIRDLAWNGETYVAVGDSTYVYTSTDGIQWTARQINSPYRLNAVEWTGQRFVAGGDLGIFYSSENGIEWTRRADLGIGSINEIGLNGNTVVAVGGPLLASSPDGITWRTALNATGRGLNAVRWTGTQFFAVGGVGYAYTSTDGENWVFRTTLGAQNANGTAQVGDQILVVGDIGAIFRTINREANQEPTIASHPQSRFVRASERVSLSVVATGTPAPTYQWRHQSAPISGATSATLNIAEINPATLGDYDVVVTNSAGSTTSRTATLSIATGLAAWRLEHFSPAEIIDPAIGAGAADPDRDGLANLAEYVLGSSPREASSPPWYDIGSTGSTWLYSFATVAAHPGANVIVEYSTDLKTWSETGIDLQPGETAGGMTSWNATLPRAGRERVFFRLRITES